MQPEVTLTFEDESGQMRSVVIRQGRFRIGRSPETDLAINDPNLSRHHAVIEIGNGSVRITDCGSRNGMTINNKPAGGTSELSDGDVITLGGACDIAVALRYKTLAPARPWFQPPVIAGTAVVLILLAAGAVLISSAGGDEGKPPAANDRRHSLVDQDDTERDARSKVGSSKPKPDPTPRAAASETAIDADDAGQIRRDVKRVMTKISNDNSPYISEAGINDVAEKVKGYRGSSALRERLRAMKRDCADITRQAQGINLKPALVMYATLAEAEGGAAGGGDPVATAQRMTPKLLTLRATFGTETANSSLLLVAAYPYPFNPPLGSQTRTPHPLASKLMELGGRRSIVDTSEARSVWFLREKNGITPEAYDLVIRLLAIGVVAQSPSRYGIDADPPFC